MKACFHLDVENTWRCDQNLPRTRDEDVKWYIDDELNHSFTSLSCKSKQNWRFYYDLHFGKWIRYFEEAHLLEEKNKTPRRKPIAVITHYLLWFTSVLIICKLKCIQLKVKIRTIVSLREIKISTSFNYGII